MKEKCIRRLDGQGRTIIPSHIREALGLKENSPITIRLEQDGSIVIRPAIPTCCVCGTELYDQGHVNIPTPDGDKLVCGSCTMQIAGLTRSKRKVEE